MEDRQWNEAKEQFGQMIRFTEQAKDQTQAEKTIFAGNPLQGIYRGYKEGVGQNGSRVYDLELADGRVVAFWGSALIDGKFDKGGPNGGAIPVGSEIYVEFTGRQQPKTPQGRPYDGFKIMWAKPVTTMQEAGTPQPGAVAPEQPAQPAPAPQAPNNMGY